MPVDSSIMLSVISGVMLPGIFSSLMSRSRSDAGFGQIIVMRIDDLHLEFDTEGERFRIDEGFE